MLLCYFDSLTELAHFNIHVNSHFNFLSHNVTIFSFSEFSFFSEHFSLCHQNIIYFVWLVLLSNQKRALEITQMFKHINCFIWFAGLYKVFLGFLVSFLIFKMETVF